MQVDIEANQKYWRVVDPVERVHGEDTDYQDWSEEEQEAADAYTETVSNTPEPDMDAEDMETLSWDLFSVSKDPDLVSKMATYFDGMQPDEPTDLLRAKLRLLDCEVYANAQIAARSELRD